MKTHEMPESSPSPGWWELWAHPPVLASPLWLLAGARAGPRGGRGARRVSPRCHLSGDQLGVGSWGEGRGEAGAPRCPPARPPRLVVVAGARGALPHGSPAAMERPRSLAIAGSGGASGTRAPASEPRAHPLDRYPPGRERKERDAGRDGD